MDVLLKPLRNTSKLLKLWARGCAGGMPPFGPSSCEKLFKPFDTLPYLELSREEYFPSKWIPWLLTLDCIAPFSSSILIFELQPCQISIMSNLQYLIMKRIRPKQPSHASSPQCLEEHYWKVELNPCQGMTWTIGIFSFLCGILSQ